MHIDGSNSSSKSSSKMSKQEYHNKQMALKAQIKPQAESLADLQNAARIKQQQIDLAREYGDTEMAKVLTEELNRIKSDISKNTSIF